MIFEEVKKNGFTEKITEYFQNVESMLNKDQGFSFPQTSLLDSLLKTLANVFTFQIWATFGPHLGCT